ncbi:MAG: hypothetical protein ACI4WM_08215 [Erysipelotrichaceae bacterium]
MLPDKNQLNDELIENISGGENYYPIEIEQEESLQYRSDFEYQMIYNCPICGNPYWITKEHQSGYCPNCEPKILKTAIPAGDIKTTVPNIPEKDKLKKIH